MNYALVENFLNEAPRENDFCRGLCPHFFLTLHPPGDRADRWNPTQATEALAVTPMYSHPGGVKGDQGWLPSLLSQHTPDLSLRKSNNCPPMNKWLVLYFLWWKSVGTFNVLWESIIIPVSKNVELSPLRDRFDYYNCVDWPLWLV